LGKAGFLPLFPKPILKTIWLLDWLIHDHATGVILLKTALNSEENMKKMSLLFCALVSVGVFAQTAARVSMALPLSTMGTITQPYGQSTNFLTGRPWLHDGIDIQTPLRTPVLAAMSGLVFGTGYSESLGNYVILDHGNKYKTIYAQLDEIVAVKDRRVVQGETMALSGNTGLSTGPHLHFDVYWDGEAVDPLSVLAFN
jgi:murein DD-endopeptidase MepM/ murein hydrolase activator NlpD